MMRTKTPSRFLCLLMSAVMVLSLLPAMGTTAEAVTAFTATADLPKNAGATLTNGNIYRVTGNTTISAGGGGNALIVADNATVVIYIPTGYTLTLNGGGGYSTVSGGAGIYLPSTSTLVLTGGGRLVANGGGSGYSGYGGGGTSGYVSGNLWNGYAYTGYGGSGGHGAGGAGAGIGGRGGSGGGGGGFGWGSNWSNSYNVTYNSDGSGYNGGSGGSGNPGTAMGNLYVLGTVSVTATGGAAAGGYGGGGYGDYDRSTFVYNSQFFYRHTASGGGGGGGGGSTRSAPAIGGGSGGAGGGGGGGGGARYSARDSTCYYSGYGGGGGAGGASGSTGPQYGGSSGGYGGGGGARGSLGEAGKLYKAAGATVSGRNADAVANTHDSVKCTITFDYQNGTSLGAKTLDVSYGEFYSNIKIPTRDQYAFMGYYTAVNGGGTRYFDHRGAGLRPFETTGALTLYAHWVQQQFNVTLDKQTGTGGTDSFITTGTDGTLPGTITPPTKEYATFLGYHAEAAGGGEKYFDTAGTAITGKKLATNSVLYAFWNQTQFRLTFGRQGGVGGTDFIYTNKVPDATAPAITPPTKQGAALLGYYTQSTGGTKIYNADGTASDSTTFAADTMLYAQWQEATYQITYVLGGGTTTGTAPASREYAKPTTIPAATKATYTFLGWQVDNLDTVRHRDLKIPAFATDYARDITLTAIWAKSADTNVVVGGNVTLATGNDATLKEELKDSFDTVVPEANNNTGVTSSDLANDKTIKLVLTVNKVEKKTDPVTPPVDPPAPPVAGKAATPPPTDTTTDPIRPPQDDQTSIDSIAQGEVLSYYNISAVKEVSDGTNVTKTDLKEIPEPIAVKIPLTGDMEGMASYRVYRVHDGKTELLPTGPTGKEFYNVENGNIVIRTRKFSTYGVVGAKAQIDSLPGEIFNGGGGDVDVQGHVIEGNTTLVYKVDIAWGAMAFEYSLDKEWDPVTHMYTEGALNAWRPASFDGVNNRIRSINHSNGAVKLNLAVTQNLLKGVTMDLHLFNEVTSTLAQSFILPPAPVGSKDADLEPATAFLFLSGPPERTWIDANKKAFAKVGVITLTVEPHTI